MSDLMSNVAPEEVNKIMRKRNPPMTRVDFAHLERRIAAMELSLKAMEDHVHEMTDLLRQSLGVEV